MADPSISTAANNNNNKHETGDVSVNIPTPETTAESDKSRYQRVLYRVPPQLCEKENHIYHPVVLSLGPYHHNRCSQQFPQVEEIKNEVVSSIKLSTKGLFYNKILERVEEIRIFYGGLSTDEYKDEALVEMMVRDACFLLYYMEGTLGRQEPNLESRLGLSVAVFLYRDYFLLENQIPLWVVKLLITLKFDDRDAGEAFICRFLSLIGFEEHKKMTGLPWATEEEEPLHLLEAHRTTFIVDEETGSTIQPRGKVFKFIKWKRKRSTQNRFNVEVGNSPFRSVTYLKSKGIYFGPSSHCLKDIRFNSYAFYGKLLLPIRLINNNTKVLFSNMIALETSPETTDDYHVLAYINFMQSLLESSKDVKELREKGILISTLRNDEEVLKTFKEIATYGMDDGDTFFDVNMRINKHCDSKAKTWMAELTHTYFRSPWTTIALFATSFLLCFTFLQTYYTMTPKKAN